ncbi:Rrf2 family transcriptional regulator [Helicobacter sp. MIT 14-3879]|uniref:RrF2 family transcriptional regulator n=1 Tax=Helicobacter sp. MIT 14-3879 TaxID=2040649 RepID=UPI000E1E3B9D|nr:Rrf2 family transcriptional regulator [Helicobacter sp. MIT 14-3879]RDU59984.1 Rrf2 family transcriptional regulator [Helicobacter sp. MIT 14-3879]
MQLSKFSDYSFRALMYLAENDKSLSTVEKMARELNISQNHLKKIIHKLSKGNFITSFKGRDGGIRLAKNPEQINLSSVLLYTETNIDIVKCLKHDTKIEIKELCPYYADCNLKIIVNRARDSFIEEFKKYSLSDLLANNVLIN